MGSSRQSSDHAESDTFIGRGSGSQGCFGQALRSAVQTLNPTGEGEVDEGRLAYEFTRNLRGAKVEENGVQRMVANQFLSAKDAAGNTKVLPPMQDWHRWTAQGDEAGSDMSVFGSWALEMARGVLSDEPYQEALMGSDYQKGEQTLHRKGLAELVAQTGLTKRTMQMASSLFPTQSKGVVAGFNPALAPGQVYQPGVDEGK